MRKKSNKKRKISLEFILFISLIAVVIIYIFIPQTRNKKVYLTEDEYRKKIYDEMSEEYNKNLNQDNIEERLEESLNSDDEINNEFETEKEFENVLDFDDELYKLQN